MKKATMVATSMIVVAIFFSFCVFGADPTNQELGQGMLKISTEIGKIKVDVGNLKKQSSGVDENRVSQLINQKAVTMDGKTLKDLKATDEELQKKVVGALDPVLILKVAKFSQERIDAFKKLDLTKPSDLARYNNILAEALQEIARKTVVDWNSPQAQMAIQNWVQTNMLGGKTLEQVMGKDPKTGKVNTDAVASMDEAYASNAKLKGTLDCVTELKDIVKKDINQGGEQIKIFENLATSVVTPLVDQVKDIHANMPKDKDGKLVPAASQKDLENKADAAYVDSEIARVENSVADNTDNLRALALKKDKAYIFVYASFMLRQDEQGFREWLRPQIDEKKFEEKFNDIKTKAQEAKAKGLVKY